MKQLSRFIGVEKWLGEPSGLPVVFDLLRHRPDPEAHRPLDRTLFLQPQTSTTAYSRRRFRIVKAESGSPLSDFPCVVLFLARSPIGLKAKRSLE